MTRERSLLAVPERLRGPRSARPIARDRRAAFASCRDGAGAPARRPLRPRPRPLGVHARRPRRASSATRCSRGARGAVERDRRDRRATRAGRQHPHVGALDVAPVVYLDEDARGAACAEALVVADRIGARARACRCSSTASSPADPPAHARGAAPRRRRGGSPSAWRGRGASADARLRPAAPAPSAGATLVAARQPLVAFNLELAPPATLDDARRDRGADPRGRRAGPAGRARDRGRAERRRRAGLDERRASARGPLAERRRGGRARTRRSRAPSSSASRPLPRSTAFPATCRSPGFDPARQSSRTR